MEKGCLLPPTTKSFFFFFSRESLALGQNKNPTGVPRCHTIDKSYVSFSLDARVASSCSCNDESNVPLTPAMSLRTTRVPSFNWTSRRQRKKRGERKRADDVMRGKEKEKKEKRAFYIFRNDNGSPALKRPDDGPLCVIPLSLGAMSFYKQHPKEQEFEENKRDIN